MLARHILRLLPRHQLGSVRARRPFAESGLMVRGTQWAGRQIDGLDCYVRFG